MSEYIPEVTVTCERQVVSPVGGVEYIVDKCVLRFEEERWQNMCSTL